MTIPYNESLSVEFGVGVNTANVDYRALHGVDIPYDPGMISVMSQRAAWDYYVGGLSWEISKTKHLNEYLDVYGLPHVGPIPQPLAPLGVLRGAFCIPDALPGIPYGDGKRSWTPAAGCYSGTPWLGKMIDEALRRKHTAFEYQLSGWPYRQDYPYLSLDIPRIVADLTQIRNAGLRTIIAFSDEPLLAQPGVVPNFVTLLQPVADATQGPVDYVMGVYEVNQYFPQPGGGGSYGPFTEDCVAQILAQQKRLWPNAVNCFHSTTQDNGGFGFGEKTFWDRVAPYTDVYFLQQSAWNHSFADTVNRASDFTARLIGGLNGWPILKYGVVLFEETTSVTYRGFPESYGVQMIDNLMAAIHPQPTGYMDGGTVII